MKLLPSIRRPVRRSCFCLTVLLKAEKIYAHESLTFNNIVACEVISKWKAGLKDEMDARSDVYVLSNGCKNCSDDSDAESSYQGFARKSKAKYTWYGDLQGSEWKYSEGVTVQVLQREVGTDFVGGTLHTVVEGSQSGDCDVEKNGKWSMYISFLKPGVSDGLHEELHSI
ncbi:hypothetical protein Tco_1314401 [Tanacetum coccineum]